MSTILKVLKKLESETGSGDSAQTIHAKESINRHVKGIWFYNRLTTVIITAILIIGGSWMYLSFHPDIIRKIFPKAVSSETSPLPQQDHDKNFEKTVTPSEPVNVSTNAKSEMAAETRVSKPETSVQNAETNIPERNQKVIQTASQAETVPVNPPERVVVSKPISDQPVVTNPASNAPPIMIKELKTIPDDNSHPKVKRESSRIYTKFTPEKPVEPAKPKLIEKEIGFEEPTNEDVLEDEKNVVVSLSQQNDTAAEKEETDDSEPDESKNKNQGPELLKDDAVKIQAVVWSEKPSRRFAVINERVVRTGGPVGDKFTVDQIGNNYVILKEGTLLWKVEFQGK